MKTIPDSDQERYDYDRLEQNITDVIREEQIKLGYRREQIRLYYPLSSLNSLLKASEDEKGMLRLLEHFAGEVESRFGKIEASVERERFCLLFPPETSEYVHAYAPENDFLVDFIAAVSRHGVTIEEVIGVFHRYSDHVHVEKTAHGEFDWLVFFEDGVPDDYRYCLTDEGHHVIYHRFTVEDYEEFDLPL